ncbi:MAG TPA: TonB-dependent receptor [Myxococcota bacterium]|nr:TonB-dependent receptor [Myxococcota bacterium]
MRIRPGHRTGGPTLAFLTLLLAGPAASEPTDDAHAHEHPHARHEETEEIVVTGSPLEHDRDELAIPIERIDRSELIGHLGSTLGESIQHVPGIATTGFAGGASRPVVRGQDAYRTEVLEDGLGTHDVSRESPDHAVPVNPLAAERVEVIRGPATLRYGGGASAGVVNVITRRIPDRLEEERVSGEVFGGIGLVADERDVAASVGGSIGRVGWHGDAMLRRAHDYRIPNDDDPHTQNGTSIDAFMGSIGAAWIEDASRLGFSYTRAENVYGIPADENVEIDMQTDRFRFEGDLFAPLPGVREVRVRTVYSDYQHDEIADGTVGQTYRNEELEGRVEVVHEEWAGFTGAVGLHLRQRDFEGQGEAAAFLAPTETTSEAIYAFEERELVDGLTTELGLRVEHVHVRGRDIAGLRRNRDFVPVSGSLGFVASPLDRVTIGLTGTVSQRAPSQVELLARGPHEATQTFEIGDPDLDMETAYAGDLRVTARHDRGRIEWSTFVTHYQDYIFAGRSGLLVNEDGDPPAPGDEMLAQIVYANRDALFYGTELSGELDLFETDLPWLASTRLGLDGRFDFVRARFLDDSADGVRNVPRITPIRWGAGLFLESEPFDARIGFVRTEAQEKTGAFERPTASFTHLDASLLWRVDLIGEVPVELSVVGRNLTDVRGRNHLSFNKEEVLLPGRSIRFGLRARF